MSNERPSIGDGSPAPRVERVVFALRQAALVVAVLCVLWLMIVFVAPDVDSSGVGGRSLYNFPMLWTVLVWPVLLLVNAVAFERTQLAVVERIPLMAGIAIMGLLFVLGVAFSPVANTLRGLLWVLLTSVGAAMFWWGAFGLVALVIARARVGSETAALAAS